MLKRTKRKQQPIFSVLNELETKTSEKPSGHNKIPIKKTEITVDDIHPPVLKTDMLLTDASASIFRKSCAPDKEEPEIHVSITTPLSTAKPEETEDKNLSKQEKGIKISTKNREEKAVIDYKQARLLEIDKPMPDISTADSSVIPEFAFVYVSPGSFLAGSPDFEPGRNSDETQHQITLSCGFYMQTTPVTQKQWIAITGENPSGFSVECDTHPVENISWYDCQKFIKKLNLISKDVYRLPTEAEWEYTCRAGSDDSCGEGQITELFCELDPSLDAAGWYCGNSGRTTNPVAQKLPNEWGVYDMHGNVMEWCQDWYGKYDVTAQKNPVGPVTGQARVIRGGSWFANAKNCRSASRFYWAPGSKSDFIGFRLVKVE